MTQSTVTIPSSEQAEQAVLGSLLIDPTAVRLVAGIVTADDFDQLKHAWIFGAILANGERADLLTVTEHLRRQTTRTGTQLDEVGGEAYIAELTNAVPTALNVEAYARSVAELARRRRLIAALQDAARGAFDQSRGLDDVITEANDKLMRLSADGAATRAVRHVGEAVAAYSALFEEGIRAGAQLPGIPLGIREVDEPLGGWRNGRLYVIGARTGAGKSALMQQAALNAAREGRTVLIFSLEMSGEEVVQRLAAQISAVNQHPSQLKRLSPEQIERTYAALAGLAQKRIFLFDDATLTPARLQAECERVRMRHGLDLVIADYAQLLSADRQARADNRTAELAYITRALKAAARRFNVPVIAGAQLNRDGAIGTPALQHLRESDTLGHDADAVILLYAPDEREPDFVDLKIAKNRDGAHGRVVHLIFKRDITRFGVCEGDRIAPPDSASAPKEEFWQR